MQAGFRKTWRTDRSVGGFVVSDSGTVYNGVRQCNLGAVVNGYRGDVGMEMENGIWWKC